MKFEDFGEVAELEKEIETFMKKISSSNDPEEIEMYRQMIKVNIAVLKYLLKK
jgi:hypothetical protein